MNSFRRHVLFTQFSYNNNQLAFFQYILFAHAKYKNVCYSKNVFSLSWNLKYTTLYACTHPIKLHVVQLVFYLYKSFKMYTKQLINKINLFQFARMNSMFASLDIYSQSVCACIECHFHMCNILCSDMCMQHQAKILEITRSCIRIIYCCDIIYIKCDFSVLNAKHINLSLVIISCANATKFFFFLFICSFLEFLFDLT